MNKVNMIYSGRISKEHKQLFVEGYLFNMIKKEEELRTKYWHKVSAYYNLTNKSKKQLCIYIFDKYKETKLNLDSFMTIISTFINNQYIYQESDGRRRNNRNIPKK